MTKRKCGDERVYEQKCNDVSNVSNIVRYTVKSQFKAHTRIMAQLELRPTSELRVFIIARAVN